MLGHEFIHAEKRSTKTLGLYRLLKLGARVVSSVRRMVVHLPQSFPFLKTFQTVALALDAAAG